MEENTDETLHQMLQHGVHQSFLRKRQVFKSQHRERKSLSEIASNAVTTPTGLRSVPGRAKSAGELPQHDAQVKETGTTRISKFQEGFEDEREPGRNAASTDRKGTSLRWMMMCLPRKDGFADLHQLVFTEPPSNNPEFFARLRLEYEAKRTQPFPALGKLSPVCRKVTGIQFVQFQTTLPRPKSDVMTVEVIENPSLPSEDEQEWICTLRRGTSTAPLPAKAMVAGFYGHNTDYEGADVYDWVPRKANEALPAKADLDAWGLYFVDEVFWRKWVAAVCVVMFVALTFGIRTAVSFALEIATDVSVSGNIVMLAQLVAGLMTVAAWKVSE